MISFSLCSEPNVQAVLDNGCRNTVMADTPIAMSDSRERPAFSCFVTSLSHLDSVSSEHETGRKTAESSASGCVRVEAMSAERLIDAGRGVFGNSALDSRERPAFSCSEAAWGLDPDNRAERNSVCIKTSFSTSRNQAFHYQKITTGCFYE